VAAQSYNLNDVYAIQFGQIANGLLSNPGFDASRLTIAQFLDIVEPLALAATRRIANTASDMSTLTPTVATFNTGWSGGNSIYTPPPTQAPARPYVRRNTVQTPSGQYADTDDNLEA
jgi:hypothetical protein